jgi:hypothetical protein
MDKKLPVCVLRWAERLLSRGKTRLQNLHLIAEGEVDPWIIRVVRSSLFGRPRLLPFWPSKLRFRFSWNLWDSSLEEGDSSGLGSHEFCCWGLATDGLKIWYWWKFDLFGVSITISYNFECKFLQALVSQWSCRSTRFTPSIESHLTLYGCGFASEFPKITKNAKHLKIKSQLLDSNSFPLERVQTCGYMFQIWHLNRVENFFAAF